MKIYESAEDYLETILLLKRRIGAVRSIDIVNELNYSKPSVSIAMKKLRENELVTVDASGYIELTEEGNIVISLSTDTLQKAVQLKGFSVMSIATSSIDMPFSSLCSFRY